ncbi:alpha/beta hydrolase fold domain-containing protein [Nocardioides litoris]|uniref:alpha/beta hydrolase fold domain-containing protein n=1 Tax=Nocardioides litoris TaxID=1926648 RepID=UPI00147693E8|nr:alpha/beta hydrolase fold domain-containing protein [Nocardioides litoris]
MPSLVHDLLAWAIPRLRGSGDLDDADAERARIERWHAGLDRSLPTGRLSRTSTRYDVRTTDEPFPVHTLRPRGARPRTTVLYLHGGGYVAPADPVHVRYALRLARHLDAEVVLPDYPLAPEHTWRDSHDALVDLLTGLAATQDRVVVAGDSAGGGLALAVAQTVRDRGGRQPSHLVLHAPWADLTTTSADREARAHDAVDPWLFLSKLEAYAAWWAGDPADLRRPEVSPAHADLTGLPPTIVFCGTRDLLVRDARLLADRAAALPGGGEDGWDLTYLEAPDLIHVFGILPGLPEARRAWRHTTAFLDGREQPR